MQGENVLDEETPHASVITVIFCIMMNSSQESSCYILKFLFLSLPSMKFSPLSLKYLYIVSCTISMMTTINCMGCPALSFQLLVNGQRWSKHPLLFDYMYHAVTINAIKYKTKQNRCAIKNHRWSLTSGFLCLHDNARSHG